MTAKIDRKLNVVIPIPQNEEGQFVYAHCAPIDSGIFEDYALMMGKAFSALYGEGYGILAGPRIASKILKEVAMNSNRWDDTPAARGVKHLVEEIRRGINVLTPTPKGWEMLPLADAVAKGFLDAADESEVENAACFFTLVWHMHSKKVRASRVDTACVLWGAQSTSSDSTEYLRSLKTSTPTASSGEATGSSPTP